MKRELKKENKHFKIIIKVILVVILVVVLGCVVKYSFDNKKSQGISNALNTVTIDPTEVTEIQTERMLQIAELQKQNSEIIGWLEVPGTNINYPVLQRGDNEFYMTHDYKKEYTKNGSLFLDKDVDLNLPSSNFLIYGHNNKNGLMFEDLLKYKEESFYKKNPNIRFTTEKDDQEYEIIAVFLSRVYYKSEKDVFRYYYFVNAEMEEEYNEYINNSKDASLYDTGKTAEYGDQLITLSTCSYHTEDGRFAVVARLKK